MELFNFWGVPERLTVEEGFAILWREHLEGKACARPFMSNRKAICKSLGGYYWDVLTEVDIQRHLNRRGAGPQTIRHDLKLLTMAYNKLKRWKKKKYVLSGIDFAKIRLPDENPCQDIKRPKVQPRKRIVTPEEFSRLIEHADDDLANLMMTMLDTGMRLNDALAIAPSAYDPNSDMVSWVQKKTGLENSVPPSRRVREIFLKAQREGRATVFSSVNLRARFETTRRRACIVNLQLGRDFRKTLYNVARRISRGPDIPRQIMGHTSNQTGEDHYYVEEKQELRPIVKKIERAFPVGKN